MAFDVHKYDEIKFHDEPYIDKKIRAYMVVFDYQVLMKGLDTKGKIDLLNHWEEVFLDEEFYEIIPAIKHRRDKLIKSDKLSLVSNMARKLSDVLMSIIKSKNKD